jgi:bifunctional oligoribonuclease and PAP phosphatase NrnA
MRRPIPEILLERLRGAGRVVITSHVNPDGDAVGSSIGLARVLRMMGKTATVWLHDPLPTLYQPIFQNDHILIGDTPPKGFPTVFDLAIVLECPSLDRTGLGDALSRLPLINIDHHLGNQEYGAINWIDSGAPAAGEMVFRLAKSLRVALDPDLADILYLTLVTDTGNFRFSNATAEAFDAAAALVRAGAAPENVSRWLFESQAPSSLRLLGEMLSSLELHHGGRVATAWLTQAMFAKAGAGPGDSEGLVDYPRSIAGVEAVALFRELEGTGTKVSLRSRGTVNVEKIARRQGGGGHQNAAGFASADPGARLQAETVEALIAALANGEGER